MNRDRYNPPGLDTNKPINLRLMRDERLENARLSELAKMSRSKLSRLAYLRGLPLVCQDLSLPAPLAGLSDGEAAAASPSSSSES